MGKSKYVGVAVPFDPALPLALEFDRVVIARSLRGLDRAFGPIQPRRGPAAATLEVPSITGAPFLSPQTSQDALADRPAVLADYEVREQEPGAFQKEISLQNIGGRVALDVQIEPIRKSECEVRFDAVAQLLPFRDSGDRWAVSVPAFVRGVGPLFARDLLQAVRDGWKDWEEEVVTEITIMYRGAGMPGKRFLTR